MAKQSAKQSAGIVVYRRRGTDVEILLVHPGGPFWSGKELHAWSIPKGEFAVGEDELAAAKREFAEETGMTMPGPFVALPPCRQSGGKTIHAFAVEGDLDAAAVRSNTFTMEWPPKSGLIRSFPEVDRAQWFSLDVAREKLHKGQAALIDQLQRLVEGGDAAPPG